MRRHDCAVRRFSFFSTYGASDYLVEYEDDDNEADNNEMYDEEESESDEEVKRKGLSSDLWVRVF